MPLESDQALQRAAEAGKVDDMRRAVAAGGDINAKDNDNDGATAAILAAQNGHRDCLEYAVTAGGDINAKDTYGATAAIEAADSGHRECLEYAVTAGGDINAKDSKGYTAVICASQSGHRECLEYAVTAGGDINAKSNLGYTAAIWAAWNGHRGCLEYAVTAGGDINAETNDGWTAVIYAAWDCHHGCLEYAVTAGGDINAETNDGYTAAIWAAWNGHRGCLEYAVTAGGDINAETNDGYTAAIYAARNGHRECLEYAVTAGGDINAETNDGQTAMTLARKYGEVAIVDWLQSWASKGGVAAIPASQASPSRGSGLAPQPTPSAASCPGSSDERKESGSGATTDTEVARLREAIAAKDAVTKEAEMVEMQVLLTCRMEHFEVLRAVGGGQNGMVFAVRCLREGIPQAAKEYALKMVFNYGACSMTGRNVYEAEFAVQSQLPPHRHLLRFWAEFYDRIPDAMMAHLPEFAREQAEYRDRRSGEMVRRRTQFIVTDYHPETLESKLEGLAMPLPYATAVKYTAQLLRGVAHMHKHRVAHLDLKLDNILVADDSRLVICDFGTAYRFRSEDMTLPVSPGMSVGGNQLHLAPEVLNAFNAAQRGDSEEGVCYAKQVMWAVGSLVHEMVLGSPPFPDYPNAYRRDGDRVSVEGEEVAELPEAYPDMFKALVRSMLHGDPVKRCECEAALALVEVLAKSS